MGDNISPTKENETKDDAPAEVVPKKPLYIKFEYKGQLYELISLTTADSVGDLRAVICLMLNIEDYNRINLKTLQPTKIIDTSDDKKPLAKVFSQAREKIIVEDVPYTQSLPPSSSFSATTGATDAAESFGRSNIKHHKPDYEGQSSVLSRIDEPNEGIQNPFAAASSNIQQASGSFGSSDESPVRQRKLPREQHVDQVPVCSSTGYLLRHPVPSNNSCLFISIHFCLTNGVVDDQIGKSMRKIIAETVASDREKFDDAFLGKSNADYCKWILDDNNWGGAIELSILCKYYETEIVAIDVKNTILARFGEDSHYPQRMLLLYDGLHYDPLKFQPIDENKPIQTLFPSDNIEVLTLAEEIAKELKQSHQFTDLKSITMICQVCNKQLDARSASEHASTTGHTNFREVQ